MSRAGISVNASGARYHEQRSKWCKGAQDWICQQTLSSPLGTKAPTLLKTTYFLPWCKLLRWLNKCLQPDNLTIWDIGGISYSKYREVLYKGILKALRKPYLFILGSNAWTTPLRFSPFRSTLPSKDRAQLLLRQNGFTLPSLLQSFGCRTPLFQVLSVKTTVDSSELFFPEDTNTKHETSPPVSRCVTFYSTE